MTDFFRLPPDRALPLRRQAAARRQLEDLTAKRSWKFLGRWQRTGIVFGLGIGLSVGGGVAVANGLFSPLPGSPRDMTLARTITVTRTGTSTVELGPAPGRANAISITLTGLTIGTFRYADGNGSDSLGCDAEDISDPGRYGCTSSGVVPLQPGQRSLTITTSPSARWTLHATYIDQVITPWKTNAHGETYGVPTKEGFPDLIAVDVEKDGHQGYEKSSELNCAQENAQGRDVAIPVYESDGTTKIGIFIVGDQTPGTPTVPLSSLTCTGPNPYQSHR